MGSMMDGRNKILPDVSSGIRHHYFCYQNKSNLPPPISLLLILVAMTSYSSVALSDMPLSYHHHIHSFYVNNDDPNRDGYLASERHAVAMGYSLVATSKPTGREFSQLGLIKLHNALVAPMRIDIKKKRIRYHRYYENSGGRSLLRPDRQVNRWYPLDGEDLTLIKRYACMKEWNEQLSLADITMEGIERYFLQRWRVGSKVNLIANWQDPDVVSELSDATNLSFYAGDYQALFFDSLGTSLPAKKCANKNAVGTRPYPSWEEGRLAFLQRVIRLLEQTAEKQLSQPPSYFANIYKPLSKRNQNTVLHWYKTKQLRLDHYYLEAGEPIKANGIDPETGLPAFVAKNGFLPAAKVSVDTLFGWYGHEGRPQYREGRHEYFEQHLQASGIAGSQGSWFGWYGEDFVHQTVIENGMVVPVYGNDMQLLRALPNWDNLAAIPLDARSYNAESMVYRSTNSYASEDIIYSRRFDSDEIFVVFRHMDGRLELSAGEELVEARFADQLFSKTLEEATPCLVSDKNAMRLVCKQKLGKGIIVSIKRAR